MIGRVEKCGTQKGFIRYASGPDCHKLDASIRFDRSCSHDSPTKGDRVSFEINERGRAISVCLIEDRILGEVVFDSRSKMFGRVRTSSYPPKDIFFSYRDVVPDLLGFVSMPIGTKVSFAIEMNGKRAQAIDVWNLDANAALATVDVLNYRESGMICRLKDDGTKLFGEVRRPNGDSLRFSTLNWHKRVAPPTLQVGDWLSYKIKREVFYFDEVKMQFRHRLYAVDLMLCPAPGADPSLAEEIL
jgi:cold shock CspA family protein